MKTGQLLTWTILTAMLAVDQQNTIGGFTRSPYEHIINDIDRPFVVRSVRGVIALEGGQGEPLSGVVFEIKGPADNQTIRRATTDTHGRFKIRHTPVGTYTFKATLSLYQSVMGTVIVSKQAAKQDDIRIELRVGV